MITLLSPNKLYTPLTKWFAFAVSKVAMVLTTLKSSNLSMSKPTEESLRASTGWPIVTRTPTTRKTTRNTVIPLTKHALTPFSSVSPRKSLSQLLEEVNRVKFTEWLRRKDAEKRMRKKLISDAKEEIRQEIFSMAQLEEEDQ